MRIAITFSFVTLLAAGPAFGQVASTISNRYGLDPYNPTDAAWLRTYGAALVAQTPLLDLTVLDTYKPSDLFLVRQIGGAMPLCCPEWGWFGPSFGPLTVQGLAPLSGARAGIPPRVDVSRVGLLWGPTGVVAMPPAPAPAPAAAVTPAQGAVATPAQGPTVASTFLRPTTNDGIWLRYEGRTWVSAGRAVPLQESERQRVGEYAGRPVYRLTRGNRDLIYVPAREGMFAPYRMKP
jgi:hypothetical protein